METIFILNNPFLKPINSYLSKEYGADNFKGMLIMYEEISRQIKATALDLKNDYANKPFTILWLARGAKMFVDDLSRELHTLNVSHDSIGT